MCLLGPLKQCLRSSYALRELVLPRSALGMRYIMHWCDAARVCVVCWTARLHAGSMATSWPTHPLGLQAMWHDMPQLHLRVETCDMWRPAIISCPDWLSQQLVLDAATCQLHSKTHLAAFDLLVAASPSKAHI